MRQNQLPDVIAKAIVGALLGGLFAGVAGFALGYGAGRINEETLTGQKLDNLYVGFEDFAPGGMSMFGMIICGVIGAFSGLIGATIGAVRQSTRSGVFAAAIVASLPVLAMIPGGSVGHWYEELIVWFLGSVSGACLATACMRYVGRLDVKESALG